MTAREFIKYIGEDKKIRKEIYLYLAAASFFVTVMIVLAVYFVGRIGNVYLAQEHMKEFNALKKQNAEAVKLNRYNVNTIGAPIDDTAIDKLQNTFIGKLESDFHLKLLSLTRTSNESGKNEVPFYEYRISLSGKWDDILTALIKLDTEKTNGKRILIEFRGIEITSSKTAEYLDAKIVYAIYVHNKQRVEV